MRPYFTILILLLFGSLQAQTADLDGSYYLSLDGQTINQVQYQLRKNGTIKLTNTYFNEPLVQIFKAIDVSKTNFETELEGREIFRLEIRDQKLTYLVLNESRRVLHVSPLERDKKVLKSSLKKLGKKSILKELAGIPEEKATEKQPPVYIAHQPTSKFHQEHAGEIVFFSEKQTIGLEKLEQVKTSFKAGEEVWAVAYLPVPLNKFSRDRLTNIEVDNFGNRYGYLCVRMDNEEEELLPEEREVFNSASLAKITVDDMQKNCFSFLLVPGRESSTGSAWLTERMAERLGNYSHDLVISLTDGNIESDYPIQGRFEFDGSPGTEIYAEISNRIKDSRLENKPLPRAVRVDPELEAEMLQQVELLAHGRGWTNTYTRAIITVDWQRMDDEFGNIKGKYVEAAFVFKGDDGCGFMEFGFLKEYLGDGQYARNIRQYTTGVRGELSCNKVD